MKLDIAKKFATLFVLLGCYKLSVAAVIHAHIVNNLDVPVNLSYTLEHSRLTNYHLNTPKQYRMEVSDVITVQGLVSALLIHVPGDRVRLVITRCRALPDTGLTEFQPVAAINQELSQATDLPPALLGLISSYTAVPNCNTVAFPVTYNIDVFSPGQQFLDIYIQGGEIRSELHDNEGRALRSGYIHGDARSPRLHFINDTDFG